MISKCIKHRRALGIAEIFTLYAGGHRLTGKIIMKNIKSIIPNVVWDCKELGMKAKETFETNLLQKYNITFLDMRINIYIAFCDYIMRKYDRERIYRS